MADKFMIGECARCGTAGEVGNDVSAAPDGSYFCRKGCKTKDHPTPADLSRGVTDGTRCPACGELKGTVHRPGISCSRKDFHQPPSCPDAPSCVEAGCRPLGDGPTYPRVRDVETLREERDAARKERDEVRRDLATRVDQLIRERDDFKTRWENTVEELTKAYRELAVYDATTISKLPDESLRSIHYDCAKEMSARGFRRLPYERESASVKKDELLERLEKIISHSIPNSITETASETAEIAEILTAILRGKL